MDHSLSRINYNRLSHIYDLFTGISERRFTETGVKMLAVQPGENVLEIGFGTGHSLVTMAQAMDVSGKMTGVDISEGMVKVTQSRLKRSGLAGQVDLQVGDATDLPFNAACFDAVFTSFTLELFTSQDIPRVLKECRRVLRPEGRIGVVALAKADGVAVRIYECVHSQFPDIIDCRPIFVRKVIEEAGFRIARTVAGSVWGLPVNIVIARKFP